MTRRTSARTAFSKISGESRTVIPRAVRDRLGLEPGDTLRYRLAEDGVLLDKVAANEAADPFAAFSEWSSDVDERAYGRLGPPPNRCKNANGRDKIPAIAP